MLFSDIKPSFLFEIKRTPEFYLLCFINWDTIYLSLILKGYSKKFWKKAQLPEDWDFILFQINLTKYILMEVRNTLLNQVLNPCSIHKWLVQSMFLFQMRQFSNYAWQRFVRYSHANLLYFIRRYNKIIQFCDVFRVQDNARTVDYLYYHRKEDAL